MIAFSRFTHVTFDCYGTLVDWESGILAALAPILRRHGVDAGDERLLRLYARYEAEHEAGPYATYREILSRTSASLASDLGFTLREEERDALARSLGTWPPFPDSADALRRIRTRRRIAVVSNVDDDLFRETAAGLGVEFDEVITAGQVGRYKPSREVFRLALERLGVASSRVLHVAQSLFHDHAPAKALGWTTVRIDRPSILRTTGIAPPADVEPDLVLPDLRSLADAMGV